MNTYFDNAGTSFPKPAEVGEEMAVYLRDIGGTYGRAAYGRVVTATAMVESCRDELAHLLGVKAAEQVVFAPNATVAFHVLLQGAVFKAGDIIYTSPLEHNAVMRPLHQLASTLGIILKVLPYLPDGMVDVSRLGENDFRRVRRVIINHQSNVNGVIQPLKEICDYFYARGIPVTADLSQSLGYLPIAADAWCLHSLFFTGHKGLLGPTGTGGYYVREPHEIMPTFYGGTGSRSDSYDMPNEWPDRMEAGTPNVVGIVGLRAALQHRPKSRYTTDNLLGCIKELSALSGVTLFGATDPSCQGALFSFTHSRFTPSELSGRLYTEFGIETRAGLHCAPQAHRTLGTFPHGTVRIALSPYHTPDELAYLVAAVRAVIR